MRIIVAGFPNTRPAAVGRILAARLGGGFLNANVSDVVTAPAGRNTEVLAVDASALVRDAAGWRPDPEDRTVCLWGEPARAAQGVMPGRRSALLDQRRRLARIVPHELDTRRLPLGEVVQRVERLLDLPSHGEGPEVLPVPLGDNSYEIHLGSELLPQLGTLAAQCVRSARGCVVTDRRVARLYGEQATTSLRDAGMDVVLLQLPTGERSKCLTQVRRLYDEFLAARLDRASFVIALGGGVVGDLAGFAAATYMRGIDYLQVPTTLMAQVDSSIGGKTAVNLPEGKNLVGAFHQPRLVAADTDALRSLPRREYRAGWAEVVKHALIADADLFLLLEAIVDPLLQLDALCVAHVVRRSCEIKVGVVRRDERESGLRAVLNCGHTIAHALERTAAYGHVRHGEAVAVGLAGEARLAVSRGMISASDASRVEALLSCLGLPVRIPVPNMDAALAACEVDKKRLAGKMRVAVPLGIGGVEIVDDVEPDEIRDALAYIAR